MKARLVPAGLEVSLCRRQNRAARSKTHRLAYIHMYVLADGLAHVAPLRAAQAPSAQGAAAAGAHFTRKGPLETPEIHCVRASQAQGSLRAIWTTGKCHSFTPLPGTMATKHRRRAVRIFSDVV